MGFSDSSLLSKVGLVVNIVGVLFTVIGFSTNYWVDVKDKVAHVGLFKFCMGVHFLTICGDISDSSLPGWVVATRAMVILGFLIGLAGVAVLIVHVFVKSDLKILNMAARGATFAAAVFVLMGIIIFGANGSDSIMGYAVKLSWSFALTTTSGVIHLVAGVILAVDKKKSGSTN